MLSSHIQMSREVSDARTACSMQLPDPTRMTCADTKRAGFAGCAGDAALRLQLYFTGHKIRHHGPTP